MLQKATVLAFVVVCIAGCIGCGTNENHYVYATIPAANQIIAYREDPNSGVLTEIAGSPYSVGVGAISGVLHPSGKYLYVANPGQNENDISLFDINASDGDLTEVTPRTTVLPATQPKLLLMDPAGAYLYVLNTGSSNISVFSIDSGSGALAAVTGSPFAIGLLSPITMTLTPSGNLLYVSAPGEINGWIEGFSVNAGTLQPLGLLTNSDGLNPDGLAVDPTGTYLYAANTSTSSIAVFNICTAASSTCLAAGSLSPVANSPFNDSGYSAPISMLLDPSGKYLYIANQVSNNVAAYSIANGLPTALTSTINGATANAYFTESSPSFLAADPSGKYLFVGNQGTSAGIQSFEISTGALTSLFTYGTGNTPSSIVVLQ